MEDFRFEQLDIWKEAIQISDILFDYVDKDEERKLIYHQLVTLIKKITNLRKALKL